MPRSKGEPTRDGTRNTDRFALDRRSYLKLAGVATGSAALLSGPASAAFTRRGVTFNHTVDMVADAGCDPTGNQPCDQQITDAADDYTLLKFPPGKYKITQKNVVFDKTNLGFLGKGDVSFVVPEHFNDKALVVDGGTGLLFEGIDLDQTAYAATPALHLGADDDLRVHDVGLVGEGIHPDSISKGDPGYSPGPGPENGNPYVEHFIYPIVRSPDGTGLVTNLHANNHGLMGTYNAGNGRCGIWVGIETKGTITFRDCRIEEFGMDGTYSSRTYGVVQFEGGMYRNNDENQIRIGSPGSYIDGAKLVIDTDNSNARNIDGATNLRGARVEVGHNWFPTDVAIKNCDIAVLSTPHTSGGVVAQHTASQFRVENTRIEIDVDGVRGVLGQDPDGGVAYAPPAKPHAATLENVSITGDAAGHEAIKLVNRPDSVIDGCCIQQQGQNRDGVTLKNSGGSVVRNTTIDVAGRQVQEVDCTATTRNISANGSCPTALYGAGDFLPHKLSFASNGGDFSYTVSVGGDLGKSTARGASINRNDFITGHTASGQGSGGGIDSYGFSGEILGFDFEGDATVYLDGSEVDPNRFPANTVSFASNGGDFSYVFGVGGDLEKSTARGASIDDNDIATRRIATGHGGGGGVDSYTFSGGIKALSLDGDATLYVNGDEVNPGKYSKPHELTIAGTGPRATYTFSTSGGLAKSTLHGESLNPHDHIRGSIASGAVGSGADSYVFLGELTSFDLNGSAAVSLDGDPAHVGRRPDHVLTISGTGSGTTYTFSTSGNLARSRADGASRNRNDHITGTTASGAVGTGADSYVFSGVVASFSLDGDANVFLDGDRIHPNRYYDHVLTVEGTGSWTTYAFRVSGSLRKSSVNGANRNHNDHIRGSNASGAVGGANDSYVFSGNLTHFELHGDANVYLDGRRSNPNRLG